MFVELVNRDDPAYTANYPVKRGTLYSTIIGAKQEIIDQFPVLYFVQETQYQQSDQLVLWRWVTDPTAQDTYNAEITYALESVTSPTYARTYTIRRDVYDNLTPVAQGTPLRGLIGVKIVDGGQDYTYATGTIDTDATIEFVIDPGGVIISGIVTNEGSAVTSGGQITIVGDGALAEATAIIQPASAVLIGQKKTEFPEDHPLQDEYVLVTLIFQTLPGPTIHSTQLHVDGVVVDVATTQKVASNIVSGETLVGTTWTITTKTQEDNVYIGKEIVITREVPGNPIPYTSVEEDGKIKSGTRTLKDTTLITSSETLVGTTWTKTNKEFLTTRLTTGEEACDLVSWEIVESRPIPGNLILAETIDDRDGEVQIVNRTMSSTAAVAAITPKEFIDAGFYTKIEFKEITELVCWKIETKRKVPGNDVVKTVIDADGDIVTETRTIVEGPPTLVTTITTVGGVYTKTFGEPINDLISWRVVQVKATQAVMDSYEAEIPDLVPEQFRAKLPVTTHEETLIGFASAITLPMAAGVLMERKAQIDYNTYRHTVRSRAFTERIQIINYDLTSEFGGGRVAETITLDLFDNLTPIDGSLTILSSTLIHIDDQVNGLAIQTTKELDDSAWPILPSRLWDENMRIEYDETNQTIDTGSSEDPNPGVFAWVSEVRAYDKWKSNKTNTSKGSPQYVDEASALIHYEFKPFKFPGLLTPITFGAGFAYYVRSTYAELIEHKLRTWWVSSSTTPTVGIPGSGADVEIEEILPDNVIISTLNDVSVLSYSGMVLHDDLTTFGVLFWPETTPNYTDYLASWQGFEKVIAGTITPEKEKDVWKIVTESVIMR